MKSHSCIDLRCCGEKKKKKIKIDRKHDCGAIVCNHADELDAKSTRAMCVCLCDLVTSYDFVLFVFVCCFGGPFERRLRAMFFGGVYRGFDGLL